MRLPNQISKGGGSAQTPRAILRKAGHAYSGCGAGILES